MFHPILLYRIVSNLILSYSVLSCASFPYTTILSGPSLSHYLMLYYLTVSYLTSPKYILSHTDLLFSILTHLDVFYLALPYLTVCILPCRIVHHLILSNRLESTHLFWVYPLILYMAPFYKMLSYIIL